MRKYSVYGLFYIAFALIICILIVMRFAIVYNTDISLPDNLFMDSVAVDDDESCIVYISGNVTYSVGRRRFRLLTKDTRIVGDMTIRTDGGSAAAFRLKSAGYIHIYPNSVVYISDLGRFVVDERYFGSGSGRVSDIFLEAGRIFGGINTYSDNSVVQVRTSSANLTVCKGRFFAECVNDFMTKLICTDGDVTYRPASAKFDYYRQRHSNVVSSFEGLVSGHNRLAGGECVILDYEMSNRLDDLIQKVYHSYFFKNIDRQYITDSVTIVPAKLSRAAMPELPMSLYQNEDNFDNCGFVEISVGEFAFVRFNNVNLTPNNRYVFLTASGQNTIATDMGERSITVNPGDYKYFAF